MPSLKFIAKYIFVVDGKIIEQIIYVSDHDTPTAKATAIRPLERTIPASKALGVV